VWIYFLPPRSNFPAKSEGARSNGFVRAHRFGELPPPSGDLRPNTHRIQTPRAGSPHHLEMPSLAVVRASNQAWKPAFRPVVVVAGGTSGVSSPSPLVKRATKSQALVPVSPPPLPNTLPQTAMLRISFSSAEIVRELILSLRA
jgi:hypothetical protein